MTYSVLQVEDKHCLPPHHQYPLLSLYGSLEVLCMEGESCVAASVQHSADPLQCALHQQQAAEEDSNMRSPDISLSHHQLAFKMLSR